MPTTGFTVPIGMHTRCTVLAGAAEAHDVMAANEAREAIRARLTQLNPVLAAKPYGEMYTIAQQAVKDCEATKAETLGMAT